MAVDTQNGRLGEHAVRLVPQECWELLASTVLGRLGFVDGQGSVTVLPVNHAVDQTSIVFRAVPGSKLAAAATEQAVCFEADSFNPENRSGWSVVLKGKAELVTDPDELIDLHALSLPPWGPSNTYAAVWVRVTADELSGLLLRPIDG